MEIRSQVKIYKSLNAIEAQILDSGKTLLGKKFKFAAGTKPVEQSFKAGEEFGKLAQDKKIKIIRFDRNGFKYHGRVKAFAEGMRKAGLEF
jgi:large subunit ribosomal protein L18